MQKEHNQKIDKKDSECEDGHETGIHSDTMVICPVCGKVLKNQLPSKTSIFEDNIPFDEHIP